LLARGIMDETLPVPNPPLPFPRSYWVVPGRFLGGLLPSDRHTRQRLALLDALRASGITYILNLMEEEEKDSFGRRFKSYWTDWMAPSMADGKTYRWSRHPIRDLNVPSQAQMITTLNTLDRQLAQGANVYVHCWGGRGRTGTVLGCWLARHTYAQGPAVLALLEQLTRHARPLFGRIPETSVQREMVTAWQAGQ